MSNGDEFFGLDKDEQVQNLEEDVVPAKKGRFKMTKGSGGAASGGKILGMCIIISLVFSMTASWFMVSMLGPSKSNVNNAIAAINTLTGDLSDFEESTSQMLTSKATESWVTNQGYSTQTWVNAKVSDLASQTWVNTRIGNITPVSTPVVIYPKVTLVTGGCNVSISGTCVAATNKTSGKVWSMDYVSPCTLNLTATSAGYGNFTGWSINGLPYANSSISINVSGETLITAYSAGAVAPIYYTLTYEAGSGGTINGTSPQTVLKGMNGSAVIAVPAADHGFVNWSDASTANPRTDINVNADKTITAYFVSCVATIPSDPIPTHSNWNVSVGAGYTVLLHWSDCGADEYKINVWDSTTGTTWSYSSSTNSYLLTGVDYDTWYKWNVEAKGECGSTQYGPKWEFITETYIP